MMTNHHNSDMRKRVPTLSDAHKWEYSDNLSKITMRVWLVEAGIARVAYFYGVVVEDDPSYAVATDYSPVFPEF